MNYISIKPFKKNKRGNIVGRTTETFPTCCPCYTGIHQELKLWPEICLAPNFQAVVQAWGTQVDYARTGVLGGRTLSVPVVPACWRLFHSGFYKNCVTTEIEQCKSHSLTRNKP